MKNKRMNLNVDFQFKKEKLSFMKNSSFHEAVVAVMAMGGNANGTHFAKEAVEKALWSIKNIPLVGLFKEDENNFGGHEPVYEVKDGEMDVRFNTTPYGVIHESAKQWFETIDENGTKKEYLVSECLFWKRQKGYELLKDKGQFSVSMEIEVLDGDYNDETELYEIKDFIFTAIAVLGDGVQPCFNSANVKLFSKGLQYNEMMADVKQFSKELDDLMKEGVDMEEVKEVELVEEEVVEEQSEQAQPTTDEVEVHAVEDESEEEEEEQTDDEELTEEQTEEMPTPEEEKQEEEEKEEEPKMFAEEDEQTEEVDPTVPNPEEDIKTLLEQVVNATTSDEVLNIFDRILVVAGLGEVDIRTLLTQETNVEMQEQLLAMTTEFEKMKSEYERLAAFEQSILAEQKQLQVEELFAKFSVLDGFDGFAELKDKAMEMPIEQVEEQLFALLGKKSFSLSMKPVEDKKPLSIVFEKKQEKQVYGTGVLDKFLIKK